MLHITNGDCAGNLLCQTDVPGELLWKDVLEEDPAPAGLSLEQMLQVRAQFIAENNWGTYESVYDVFPDRDRRLAQFHKHEEVVLWFEHDLHDQLQIMTELGCDVLARQADWVTTNGIDRWLGGVHLCRKNTLWRWDEQHQKLVQEISSRD